MGNYKNKYIMKFVIAALIATVAAQDGGAGMCETAMDCDDNFDAIMEEWEANEDENKDAFKPVKGEMACAKVQLAGEDDEGNSASFNIDYYIPEALCDGFSVSGGDDEGNSGSI